MRARDQSSIFSTGGKFRPDYGLLLELHALTLVARSYVLFNKVTAALCAHLFFTLFLFSHPFLPPIPSPTVQCVLADVWVVPLSELGSSDRQIHCRTHLGHLIKTGDTVWG